MIFRELGRLGAGERENLMAEELLAGNVPSFLRALVPVPLDAARIGARQATAYVTPDYLCLGSDEDFVRVAVTWRTARKVAAAASAAFPTRDLVDAVYAQAPYKLTSPRMNAGAGHPADILKHHEIIERRRRRAGAHLGDLIAGCKKELVLSKRLLSSRGHAAIYGWFLKDGSTVQPLSLIHDDRFLDYVQGVRLVDRRVHIDGREVDLLDLLADRELAPLLSDEGRYDLRVSWERGW